MKTFILPIIFLAAVLIGCAVSNPKYTKPLPGQPDTNTEPAFVPDPRINSYSNTVKMTATGLAPVNPYAGITDYAIDGVFGLIAMASGYIARQKSKTVGVMADAIVKTGVGQQVLDHASNTDHFVAVADAVNSASGANQSNTGAPKTP